MQKTRKYHNPDCKAFYDIWSSPGTIRCLNAGCKGDLSPQLARGVFWQHCNLGSTGLGRAWLWWFELFYCNTPKKRKKYLKKSLRLFFKTWYWFVNKSRRGDRNGSRLQEGAVELEKSIFDANFGVLMHILVFWCTLPATSSICIIRPLL